MRRVKSAPRFRLVAGCGCFKLLRPETACENLKILQVGSGCINDKTVIIHTETRTASKIDGAIIVILVGVDLAVVEK
eukprot:gene4572-biopygen12677